MKLYLVALYLRVLLAALAREEVATAKSARSGGNSRQMMLGATAVCEVIFSNNEITETTEESPMNAREATQSGERGPRKG